MNDREIMEAAIRHMSDTNPDPDESFFRQLWDNLRIRFTVTKKQQSVTITDEAKF